MRSAYERTVALDVQAIQDDRAAARIGLKVSGLEKFLYRHGRSDLYRKLRADV